MPAFLGSMLRPQNTLRSRASALRWLRPIAVGAVAITLGGCFYANTSQAPIATTYPYTEQQRMQAAHHWNVLAQHEADGILANSRVRFRDLYLQPDPDAPANENHGGEFGRGFQDLLTSQLVSRGATVTTEPSAQSATVRVNVEVVNHRDRGYIRPPRGAFTALAGGVAVATHPFNHWSEPALALIPAAIAADITSGSWTYTGDEEIIVTTQIVDGERILYSSSNIYYTNQGDRRHYAPHRVPKPPATPTVSITDSW